MAMRSKPQTPIHTSIVVVYKLDLYSDLISGERPPVATKSSANDWSPCKSRTTVERVKCI